MRAILVACALLAGHLRGGAAAATYYEMLGIEEDASERQIKRAFRRLSLKYHPDKCKEESCQERFVEASSGAFRGAGGRDRARVARAALAWH